MPIGVPADVGAALACYFPRGDVPPVRVVDIPQGFSGARVWKIEFPDASFALRRWPPEGLPPVRIRGLHRLLAHLAERGLTFVAVPVRNAAGDSLSHCGGRLWQLEPWLPGVADFHDNPSMPRLRAAVSAVARWHLAAAGFTPDPAIAPWFASCAAAPSPAVQERLARLRRLTPETLRQFETLVERSGDDGCRTLSAEIVQRVRSHHGAIRAELEALERTPFALQPCLRDIWHDHVLFRGELVTGLVDPSACRTEHPATDLARLVGSLIEDDAGGWRVAVDEYRRHRPWSIAEEALLAALDRSGVVLSAVTWLDWLFVERRTFPDPNAVRDRLQWLHRRLGRLSAGAPV